MNNKHYPFHGIAADKKAESDYERAMRVLAPRYTGPSSKDLVKQFVIDTTRVDKIAPLPSQSRIARIGRWISNVLL